MFANGKHLFCGFVEEKQGDSKKKMKANSFGSAGRNMNEAAKQLTLNS